MPSGYPRTEPLPICKRKACHAQVKQYRARYCSQECFNLDRRGIAFTPTSSKRNDQPNTQTVVVKPPTVPLDYWWMRPDLPREGLTQLASQRSFSQDRKAMVLPTWINE